MKRKESIEFDGEYSFVFWKRKGKVEVLYDNRNVSVCVCLCVYTHVKEQKKNKSETKEKDFVMSVEYGIRN